MANSNDVNLAKTLYVCFAWLWDRCLILIELTNSTAITGIAKFYFLFAPWNTTWHSFYPIDPRARAKLVGIENKVEGLFSWLPPPPPPLTSSSIFYSQCPLQIFHRGFIVCLLPSSFLPHCPRTKMFFFSYTFLHPLLSTPTRWGEWEFSTSRTNARHQIFSFFDETLLSKATVSLFFWLLIFFFSLFFTMLNVLYDFSACVSLAMFSRAFVLSCLLLWFSFARMSSWVQTFVIVVFLVFICIFHSFN